MKSFLVGSVRPSAVLYKALLLALGFMFLFVTTADASVTRKRGTQATALQIEWTIVGGSGTCNGTTDYDPLTDGIRTAWVQNHNNSGSPLTLLSAGQSILETPGTYTFTCTDAGSGQSDSDTLIVTDCLATEHWTGTTCAANVPRLIICPATTSYTVGNTGNFSARYWSHLSSAPNCSTTGYSNVTNSTSWSSTNGSRFSVSNAVGSKGAYSAVSAGSATVNATYGVTSAPGLAVTVTAAAEPDLVVRDSLIEHYQGTLVQGQTVAFRAASMNSGSGDSPAGVTVDTRFRYRFNGGTWLPAATYSRPRLLAGAFNSADGSGNITLGATGTLEIEYWVDYTGTIAESNNGNNSVIASFTVVPAGTVDLRAESLSPANGASVSGGSNLTITGRVHNDGTATAAQAGWADLEIDTNNDGNPDLNYNAYGGLQVGSLVAGANRNLSYTISAPITPGVYRYRFRVDTTNVSGDSNTTNNVSAWRSVTVTAPAGDCTNQLVTWTVGANTCSGNTTVTSNGNVVGVSSTNGNTGSRNYMCNGVSNTYTGQGAGTCTAAPNNPPTANAGSDVAITLPTTQTFSSGASASDSDGIVASVLWYESSRPSGAPATNILSANTMSPTFRNLTTPGIYVFALEVTDDDGARASDTMRVTVSAAPTYSCTAPYPVAFASYYPGDDTGLSADTPGAYSSTNTGAKCQWTCNTAYWWNGSTCVLPDLTAVSTGPVNGASFTNLVSIAFTGEARNSAVAPVTQGGWADLEIDIDSNGTADMNWNAFPPTYSSRVGSFLQSGTKALNRTLAAGTLAPGSYRYRFHVDTDGTGVAESNESNNASAWRSFTVTATAIPTLSATTHTSVTQTSATIGATLDSDGGSPIIAQWRGTCIATTPSPSGAACVTIGGTALGAFTANRTGLTPGTTYYYRGYADNAVNRGYSPERSFTTLANVPGAITVTPQACGTGQNFLDWPDATGAASYSIYNADTNAWIGNSLGSNYTHNGSQSTTYRYYVRANNSAGDQSANSPTSAPATTLGPCAIDGVCGAAARTYGFNESAFTGALCSVGSASPAAPAFPAQGATTNWQCLGQFGGSNAACSAPRDNPPPPEVTVGDCTIAVEGNTCTRNDVTWNLEAFAGPYTIRNITNGSQIAGTASTSAAIPVGAGRLLTLNYGLNTINALAGGTSRASDTANASCNTAAGHFWHNLLGTPVCKALPSIDITAPLVGSGTLVRSGDTVTIEYEVNANYDVRCDVTGLNGGGPTTYNHTGAPGWVAATPSETGALTAAQVVRIDCGVVGIPASYNSQEIRIDVIPPYQET